MVIDELFAKKSTTLMPIDSYDNKMIDEIIVEGQKFHFAKQKDLTGTSEIVADNGVAEPIISLGVSGNTSQKQYQGYQQICFKDFTKSYTDTDGNVLNAECKDGIVTLNGKTNKRVQLVFDYTNMSNRTLKAGTYTFTGVWVQEKGTNGVIGATGNCDCRYFDNVTGKSVYFFVSKRTVITFENDVYIQYMQPYMNMNVDIVNAKFAIGVFKGDVATADFPPYEPYVGGIPSPNPQYPQEIENANNEGMSVTLHGYNLLNKEEFGMSVLRNETEYKGYGGLALSVAQVNTMLKPNTTYTMSFDVEGVEGMPDRATIHSGQGFIFTPALSGAPYIFSTRSNKIANKGEVYTHTVTFTTVSNFYEAEYRLFVYTGRYTRTDGTMDNATCIFRNVQIVEGAEEKPYQPYFREEIAIPTSVEVGGVTVDLNMGAIGDYADSIVVDRISNKVIYNQNTKSRVLTGEEDWKYTDTYKGNPWYQLDSNFGALASSPIGYGKGLCNVTKFVNVNQPDEDAFGCRFSGGNGNRFFVITAQSSSIDTFDKFKSLLADLNTKGTPFTIQYVVRTITRDITNTDLGQSLLALATGKGTNYLEISSNLEPSKTDLSYWRQIIPNE